MTPTPQPGARLEAHDPLGQAIIEYAETFMGDGQPLLTRAAAWVNVTRTFAREQDATLAELTRQRDALLAALENLLSDRWEEHAAIGDTGECMQGCVKCGHERDAEAAVRDAAQSQNRTTASTRETAVR